MKIILCFTIISLYSFGIKANQDIVLKSRFDLESSEAFINQLRIFLNNNNFGDPYEQEFKKPIVVDLAKTLEDIPQDTQVWIRELQNVLRVQVFESDYKMIFDGLSYSIDNFNSEFKPGKSLRDNVDYVTINYVRGVHLRADKIIFEVELKRTQTGQPIKFRVELIAPEFIVSPELTANLPMAWSTSILPENLKLSLDSIDISQVMERIVKNPQLIQLSVKDMVMPDVSVLVGPKEVKLDKAKIKRFLIEKKEDLKKGMLDLLNVRMSERFSNILRDNSKVLLLPRTHTFTADFNGVLDLQRMEVNRTGIVQFDIDGHFCKDEKSLENNFCYDHQIKSKMRRIISLDDYERSLRQLNRSLIERKTNIAVSVSEHYLNQVVETTIKNGLWEESLKGNNFKLGPEKSFVLAEEPGELFSLYLDIVHKLEGSQRILVGRSELRFPVKLMIALKVEDLHGIPHFTIKVKKIATDEKLLIDGLPKYGLMTTVSSVPRFRAKVIKRIIDDLSSFQNKMLIDFELKELKGTYLHQMEFTSDGQGRGSATIGFNTQDFL